MSIAQQDRPGREYLWPAAAATGIVLTAPLLWLTALWAVSGSSLPALPAAIGSLVAVAVAAGTGGRIWARSHRSTHMPFGELMLWTWIRRRRAEDAMAENVRRLGLDRTGRRVQRVGISSDDQLLMLRQLSESLEVKDPYTRHHSSRVERHCFQTALALGLTSGEIKVLRQAASVHDVGKIRVRNEILRKPGKLTAEERAEIERHPVIGARMVSGLLSEDITMAVRHHHERWDGRGYPDGLSGSDIPLFARIIAVADTYDAITSTRAYRPRAGSPRAQEIIRAEGGAQFDPEVVEAFLSTLADRTSLVGGLVGLLVPEPALVRMSDWIERTSTGGLGPALASAAAVGVLVPGMMLPPGEALPRPETPAPPPVIQADHGPPLGRTLALGGNYAHGDSDFVGALRQEGRSSTRVLGKSVARKNKGKVSGKAGRVRQAPKPVSSKGTPGSVPALENTPRAPGDPQPDKGRDCDHPGNRDSRGYALHCGS